MNCFHNENGFSYGWIRGLFLLLFTVLGSLHGDDAKDSWELTWLYQLHQGIPLSWPLGET